MTTDFRTRDLRDAPFVLVILISAAGIGYSAIRPEHWLRGVGCVGLAMMVAAGFRLLLTDRQSGLLAIRRRPFDVVCYLLLGGAILGVGILLPH
ncbi:MAG: DUF3017 domain-containing protein [Jatrophihabitans sp.]